MRKLENQTASSANKNTCDLRKFYLEQGFLDVYAEAQSNLNYV